MSPRVAALLAAGGGRRWQAADPSQQVAAHKLLAPLDGRPVWTHALGHALAAGFDLLVVVTGAVTLDPATPVTGLAAALDDGRVTFRHHPGWADGQAGSLQVAIAAARETGAAAVTVGLADQPFVTAEAWRAVADAAPDARIVVATYDGTVGPNPVRLHREVWPLLPTDGDEGARSVIRLHPEWVVHVPCLGSVADIDTPEDLHRWNNC